MSSTLHEEDDQEEDEASAEFLRDVARVEERLPPSATPRLEGTNIGQFHVLSELGRGGMGIVYLAEDEKLRRKVALKVLRPSFAADEERRRRFLREARAAAAVSHPNLVTIFDAGEHDGRAYLAMEYLRGQSLRQVLSERPLGVDEAVELARQVLAGLAHAHAAGLLHRDLKPENVLVGRDGRPRLLDFGLAKLAVDIDISGEHSTKEGRVLGTPGYMSPEQARGQFVDARTDVFSFGVMFYEMLTRHRPFTGSTTADVITSLLRDTPPRADVARPEIGPALADVVECCLEKSADARFSSVAMLIEALDDASTVARQARLAAVPSRAAEPTPRGRGDSATPESPRSTPKLEASPWRKRIIAGTIGAAAALASVVGISSMRHSPGAATGESGAAQARRALAITDQPPPKSSSPEALASYAQGLQAIRDADWAIAEARFNEAIARDPALSAAHLRMALLTVHSVDSGPSYTRAAFGRAMAGRANLSERDRALLFALEPLINRDPAEKGLAQTRLRELAHAHPDDAELWHFFACLGVEDSDEGLAASRRAVEIDPQFADAWQILAAQLAKRGDLDEAHAAIDRCIAISPLSADCRGERASLYGGRGECAKMEEDLRRGISSNPRASAVWHEERAAALLAVGRSDDTVLAAFQQKWALYSEERRKGIEPYDRALLATVRGRFAEADALLAQGEKVIDLDPDAYTHSRYAGLRVALARETGRVKDAATFAKSYVTRKDVWLTSVKTIDCEVPMLRVMEQGGLIPKDEFLRRRDAWYDHARTVDSGTPAIFSWLLAYAEHVESPAEAKEALAVLPKYDERQGKQVLLKAELGHTHLLAGNPAAALPLLETSTRSCNWLSWPIANSHALLNLGLAREQLDDKPGACEAYQRVVARWGSAQRSKTAAVAKARVKALACPGEARDTPPPAPSSTQHARNEPDEDFDPDDIPEPPPPLNPPPAGPPPNVQITPPVVRIDPPSPLRAAPSLSMSVKKMTCTAGAPCVCDESSTVCEMTCPGGSCAIECRGNAVCSVKCPKGGCKATATGAGPLNVECAGGGCKTDCNGPGVCSIEGCRAGCKCNRNGSGVCVTH